MWFWENRTAICKRLIIKHFLTPYTQKDSKWVKDLNLRVNSIKLFRENIVGKFPDTGFGNDFSDKTAKAQVTKVKLDRWGCMSQQSKHTTMNKRLKEWKAIFPYHIYDQR